jgi:hypothetical protein
VTVATGVHKALEDECGRVVASTNSVVEENELAWFQRYGTRAKGLDSSDAGDAYLFVNVSALWSVDLELGAGGSRKAMHQRKHAWRS